ncbi:hypothetical protein [Synechococcus sp. CBW1107]|uniref:hypothetical protein n=1 Tax=Synechococcus sp. CBW1107 TaxID=2789857 RepID=UPI002AD336B3|nr:hypothetical protein [Synechococcus sp. CBW1107]CAK6686862.1 hypothetical protein ICNINCKA_00086 [Synechococcus sp. CBW1107]
MEVAIDRLALQQTCGPIRLAFEAVLQRATDLGFQRGERTPWAKSVRTCHKLLQVADGLWTFLEIEGVDPTTNAAVDEVFSAGVRALRPSVIQRKISHGVQSTSGAIGRSRLLTVTTPLRQQGRDVSAFLEQAWIAHHRGGLISSLLPDP